MYRRCGQCRHPLSRNNTGDLCGACTIAARAQPASPIRLEPGFWDRPEVRSALSAHDWCAVLVEVQKASGASQARIAEAAGVSQAHISRIVTGRVADPSFSMVVAILTGLGAPFGPVALAIGATTGKAGIMESAEPTAEGEEGPVQRRVFLTLAGASAFSTAHPATAPLPLLASAAAPGTVWAADVHAAVLNPAAGARRAAQQRDGSSLRQLKRAADGTVRASLASDYTALTASLPELLGQIEHAQIYSPDGERKPLLQLTSDVYAVTGWTLIKADSALTAWTAAQRAIQAAEEASDPLRAAAATRCLAEVHMRAGNFDDAVRTALLASAHLDMVPAGADDPAVLCLRGAALLSAAAAAARRGDRREAYTALGAAEACAQRLKTDRADLGTVFGPTNVAIHRVAIAIELGDAQRAVDEIPGVDLARMPALMAERGSRFRLDAARALAARGQNAAAIDALLEAEAIAPDELRRHRLTRKVINDLLNRERRSSGLRELADRCQALA